MIEFIDLFCGAGGMSFGLVQAGMCVRLGIDSNRQCIATFSRNFPEATAMCVDVSQLTARQVLKHVTSRSNLVVAGCPPCQLFSQLHRSRGPVGPEIKSYLKLIDELRPICLVFENVPLIRRYSDAWGLILKQLTSFGYKIQYKVVCAAEFGVPQYRKRLLLVAARKYIEITVPTNRKLQTVRKSIGSMPEADSSIPNHITMKLAPQNLKRIRQTPHDGGTSKQAGKGFDDSYARMFWDKPAPTITTRCISFSNGRFGHPVFDRAMTVREAAFLQGFPKDFVFEGGVWETARQVGNAVPPPIAKAIGEQILRALVKPSQGRLSKSA